MAFISKRRRKDFRNAHVVKPFFTELNSVTVGHGLSHIITLSIRIKAIEPNNQFIWLLLLKVRLTTNGIAKHPIRIFNRSRTTRNNRTAMWIFLIAVKPYSAISIAQITRVAHVFRTSFYRHYQQKDNVLKDYLQRLYNDIIKDIQTNHLTTLRQQLQLYLTFFKNNPRTLAILLSAGFEGILLDEQTKYLKSLLAVTHPDLKLNPYAISYQSGGIFMLLVWWVKQDYQTPLSVLLNYVTKHLNL